MICTTCESKGYVESSHAANNKMYASFRLCPACKDVAKYSAFIQARYGGKPEAKPEEKQEGLAHVIPFRPRKKQEEA